MEEDLNMCLLLPIYLADLVFHFEVMGEKSALPK